MIRVAIVGTGGIAHEHMKAYLTLKDRCQVAALVEMVTEPDLHSPDEAAAYLMRLRQLIRWIGISE